MDSALTHQIHSIKIVYLFGNTRTVKFTELKLPHNSMELIMLNAQYIELYASYQVLLNDLNLYIKHIANYK